MASATRSLLPLVVLAVVAAMPGLARAGTPASAPRAPAKAPAAPAKAAPKAPQKVAVMAVHTTGIEKGIGSTLTDVLTSEVASVSHLQVIGANDIKSLLGFQAQKQLLGCSDDASCLAQIGGALGVDLLVVAQVGRIGKTYVVSVKLLRIDQAKVEGRTYETVRGAIDEVIGRLKAAVHTVFAQAGLLHAPAVAEAAPAAAVASSGGGAWHVHLGSWVLWGAGALVLAAGTGLGLGARGAYDQVTNKPNAPGDQQVARSGMLMQTSANLSFGVGAAALLAGTVVLLVDHGSPAPRASVAPVAGRGTYGAVATVRF